MKRWASAGTSGANWGAARNYARPRSEEVRGFHAGADELLCASDASHSVHAHVVASVPEARVLYSPSRFSTSDSAYLFHSRKLPRALLAWVRHST